MKSHCFSGKFYLRSEEKGLPEVASLAAALASRVRHNFDLGSSRKAIPFSIARYDGALSNNAALHIFRTSPGPDDEGKSGSCGLPLAKAAS
jgi:hypothetical protein